MSMETKDIIKAILSFVITAVLFALIFLAVLTESIASDIQTVETSADLVKKTADDKSVFEMIVQIFAAIIAPSGIFGMWAKYTMDRKERKEMDKLNTNAILSKIEENDKNQNNKIAEIESKIHTLLESEKITISIKKLKNQLEQTGAIILDGVVEPNVKETVSYGVTSVIDIFEGVLLQDFALDIDTISLQLKVAINKIVSFDSSTTDLKDDALVNFKKDLFSKLNISAESFCIELRPTLKLYNGERRKTFIEQCNDFIRKTILSAIELYKYHRNKQ